MADLHPPISNTSVNINPALATARNAGLYRDHPALRYASVELSYSELDDTAARLAAVLTGDGVSAGDRVAYAGMNSAAFLITMLAAWRIGAIFVPTNFRLATAELEHVLTASGAAAIISEPGHKPIIDSVRGRTPLKSLLLVDDDPEVPRDSAPDGEWEPWSTALAAATPVNGIAPAGFDDPALLMFTSGTTGLPKGVVLTHGNLWWNSVNVDSRIDTRRGDVTYAAAPLFHIGALNSFTIPTLVRGGTVVLRRTFAAQQCLTDLIDYQVNTLFAVPTMLAALSRVPGVFDADLSHVRAIVVAGAPVPPSLLDQYAQCGIPLQQAWGLTETAPFATHLPVERTTDKLGSAGIPMPHTEVRVVDTATNEPVAADVPGEILVRGPNVTPGYWQNPAATAAAIDADGWFHSGDIGYLDEEGYLYIVDRLKDMVISGGENIYPAEVERVLADMPGVTDVAVIGVADEKWGETVAAVISLTAGVSVTIDDVRHFAETKLARYKLPRRLHVVDSVPRNASGKIAKPSIRRLLADQPNSTGTQ